MARHDDALRDGGRLAWVGAVALDVKFGFRMLAKYPGLTVVGGLAMAFAVWMGVVVFAMVTAITHPTIPLPNGDRIVQVRNWDVEAGKVDDRVLHDFVVWRGTLASVTDLGAYRDDSRSLIAPGVETGPVMVAEITSSAFRVAPIAPLLGRVLGPEDERAGAPPVIVLGYDVWKQRFAGDARVLGRSVQLGERFATVVGVMPAGFAFPVSHDAWTPLQSDALNQAPREGPGITVFGRLAPGVSIQEAQVELSTLGKRAAAELRATHEHLLPQVVPYSYVFQDPTGQDTSLMYSFNVIAMMLLVLVCGNVALLMFARAATRQTELVVRSALGASRGRIIGQLFAEALVLGAVAAAVGLTAAYVVLDRYGLRYLEMNIGRLPFWYDIHLSLPTVLYAGGLTLLGAAIAGVLPALKVMRGLGAQLRQGTAGAGGVQFGGVWTAVIITQVAFTVAFPALAYVEQRQLARIETFPAGFAAEEYLSARLVTDVAAPASGGATSGDAVADSAWKARGDRLVAALDAVRQRVAAEPGVLGVTFVDRLPREGHVEYDVELDDDPSVIGARAAVPSPSGPPPLREVSTARIDETYFDVLNAPMLAGRNFTAGDRAPGATAVIVDRGFVDQVLQGRNAIGRRVRFVRSRGRDIPPEERTWLEIVGVVKELGMGAPTQMGRAAGLYLPTTPGREGPAYIVVHVRGDPMSLASRVRAIPAAVDPTLRVSELQRVDDVTNEPLWFIGLWFRITLLLIGVALLLSLAGIYSVLSFAVARRTREIGVRVALGSDRRHVVGAIFRRPLTQVGIGVAAGGATIGLVMLLLATGGLEEGRLASSIGAGQVAMLVAYAAFMMGVCLLACVVPTRRALRVEPTEALRAE